MPPILPITDGKPTEPQKSWKKINEERKALKKKRKQDKVLKDFEKAEKLKELSENVDTTTSTVKPNPSSISIAIPGSILENAQSVELRTYVAGQIARAACIFRVNEVIVFDDVGIATARETKRNYAADDDDSEVKTVRGSSLQLARILQYLECPQYLRKFFFPLHKDLKYSGLLNPLDAPHHLRQQNVFPYREGIVTEKRAKDGHCYVNVGLLNDVLVDRAIESGVRVTVKFEHQNENTRKLRGTVVSPDEPRRETGAYWGYSVRIAHTISEIFTKSPYEGSYDLTVGTSDRGENVHNVPQHSYDFQHLLIVFGGLKGLEAALGNDDKLTVDDPSLLFDHYVNVLPRQGSRTIRTEEAVLIAMAALQDKFKPKIPDIEESFKEFLPQSEDTGFRSVTLAASRNTMTAEEKFGKKSTKNNKVKTSGDVKPSNMEIVEADEVFHMSKKRQKNENSAVLRNNAAPPIDATEDDFEVVASDAVTPAGMQGRNDLSRFD